MKEFIDLKNKNITVMGLGLNRGGLGITKFLAQSGANVLVTDLKGKNQLQKTLDELKDYNIEYVLGCHKTENFTGKDMIIQNPGVPNNSKYLQIARELG
ncbi:MAG: UDP-N-acetylmuramoyl-L-alanine--D-glutamate ligase, partial [Atribacterota bacterium]|nr:UDP-N-acetylmuramoyl-L-alanine--D-glutamate ligase [Atribacterota bacterium]